MDKQRVEEAVDTGKSTVTYNGFPAESQMSVYNAITSKIIALL